MIAIAKTLRCFDGIARHGSVRKAAGSLHLTPAAVHRQLVNLEAQVGLPLFDRVPRGMQLTPAGEVLLAAVRRGERELDAATAQIDSMRSLGRGSVGIAVSEASADSVVAVVIETMTRAHPGIDYRVRTGHGETIVKWVADGDVDFGYCLQRPVPRGVVEMRSWRQCLGVIVAPDHPLAARRRRVALRACLEHPLVLATPEMELRAWVERLAQRVGQELAPWVETSSIGVLRRLVRNGGCAGFSIAENVAEDVAGGALRWLPLSDPDAISATCLYQRRGRALSPAAGAMLEGLDAAVTALAGSPRSAGR